MAFYTVAFYAIRSLVPLWTKYLLQTRNATALKPEFNMFVKVHVFFASKFFKLYYLLYLFVSKSSRFYKFVMTELMSA